MSQDNAPREPLDEPRGDGSEVRDDAIDHGDGTSAFDALSERPSPFDAPTHQVVSPPPAWAPAPPPLPPVQAAYGAPPAPAPPYAGQQHPGQTYQGQPFPGQPYPGQPSQSQYPGQPYPSYGGTPAYATGGYPATSGRATAVLVLGIAAIPTLFVGGIGFIAAIVALALAPGARRDIRSSGGALVGEGQVRAGRVLAIVALVIGVLLIAAFVLLVMVSMTSPTTGSTIGPATRA